MHLPVPRNSHHYKDPGWDKCGTASLIPGTETKHEGSLHVLCATRLPQAFIMHQLLQGHGMLTVYNEPQWKQVWRQLYLLLIKYGIACDQPSQATKIKLSPGL